MAVTATVIRQTQMMVSTNKFTHRGRKINISTSARTSTPKHGQQAVYKHADEHVHDDSNKVKMKMTHNDHNKTWYVKNKLKTNMNISRKGKCVEDDRGTDNDVENDKCNDSRNHSGDDDGNENTHDHAYEEDTDSDDGNDNCNTNDTGNCNGKGSDTDNDNGSGIASDSKCGSGNGGSNADDTGNGKWNGHDNETDNDNDNYRDETMNIIVTIPMAMTQ